MSTNPRARRWRRVMTTISLTAVALVGGAGIAAAHVSVTPSEATAGDEVIKLTFRVPNESETAGTVTVTVGLSAEYPFADVSVKAVPGWTVTPTKTTLPAPVTEGAITIKEAVTSVTWTADAGTQIGPGEFAEFDISAGPVPEVASLEFPVTQTYSDGTVVEWNESTPASGEEPEHPAPTLTIGEAVAGAGADGAGPSAEEPSAGEPSAEGGETTSTEGAETASAEVTSSFFETAGAEPAAAATTTDSSSSSTATILAAVSIVVAAAALLVAAFALRRKPGGPASPPREG